MRQHRRRVARADSFRIGKFWLTSLPVVNRMRAHPHRQQEHPSSGLHTVLTGVPVLCFIVLAGIISLFIVYILCFVISCEDCCWEIMMEESEYMKQLSRNDQDRYKNKLTLADGTQLADPYTLDTGWEDDITRLPNITWRDVTSYLIDTPSVYTKESMKAYKSLDAFNYFMCGHVQDCFYHKNSNNQTFCFIKTKVSNTSKFTNPYLLRLFRKR